MQRKRALTIAGSDSGGGAGIQADLRAFAHLGVHGTSVITCVTAQNTTGVHAIHPLTPQAIAEQLDAVLDDLPPHAIKTGMLHSPDVVGLLIERLPSNVPLVVDPVMVATTGDALAAVGFADAVRKLVGKAVLVTPNADELRVLTGMATATALEARVAARDLIDRTGVQAVLVKGGHVDLAAATVNDQLVTADDVTNREHPRRDGALHGAGCHYASLLTGLLALGMEVPDAFAAAHDLMQHGVENAYAPGAGPAVPGILNPAYTPPR